MQIVHDRDGAAALHARRGEGLGRQSGADRPLSAATRSRSMSTRWPTGPDVFVAGIMEHIEEAGIHSGDSRLLAAALLAAANDHRRDRAPDRGDGQGAAGRRPDERAVRGQGRRGLRAGGQSARQPHRAVRRQGDRPADRQDRRPRDGRRDAEAGFAIKKTKRQAHRGQGSGVPVRALPRRRHHPRAGDALDRRGHGAGPRFRPRLRQGAARRRQQGCRSTARCSSR